MIILHFSGLPTSPLAKYLFTNCEYLIYELIAGDVTVPSIKLKPVSQPRDSGKYLAFDNAIEQGQGLDGLVAPSMSFQQAQAGFLQAFRIVGVQGK